MPDKFNMSSMYKIGIGRGGNAFHSITKDGTERKVAYSTLLRCEATPIWITWKNGRIAAGNGTDVTMNVAIEWTDGEPLVIKDIGLSSWNKIWTFQIIDPLYA
ncbi:hypothetical protein FSP39_016392 [Pinctada imbricata]|uniref:Farnesoic acid O-methyl transferase domain-containing protein n=1 Tax=Pinctada imbricata TaxID=66713 RepID=A0AA89BNQ8_PINIB|nr:hypothetical protein FSP39_016392 [Pinctada imbricata]